MSEKDNWREEFERTKTFKYFYSVLMHFDEDLNCYLSNNSLRVRDAELLTAAWWAFQEQQAKVEELQKRVDKALKLIESWNKTAFEKTTHWTEGYEEGCYHCAAQLEQALKGEA